MQGIQEAIDGLRSALHYKGVENQVQDAFNHLASCLVLLNSSSPSVQMIRKLCTVLRQPLLPLYNACLQPALHLSSCILSTVLGKLCDAYNVEDEQLRSAWDDTAKVILSGILDFLDKKDGGDVGFDDAVWETLYRVICEFFFLDSLRGLPVLSVQLCLSAYNTLTETATKQITVRNALRQKGVLGGERLGVAISRARDYLLLEALLMLFARLLPPIHNTSQGKFKRLKFVKEVLGSPKLFKCSAEMLDIMQKTSGTQWDDVAAQIIDALARNDVTCPQPFSIDEIDVCGHVFPQPLATDRLIMDKQNFLANVIVENNDLCESLQVPYSHIRKITLDPSEENVPKGKVLIMVYLMSAPLVADVELKSSDGNFYAKFLLQNDDVGRFMEALRRRGVGKLSFLNPPVRKRKNVSISSGLKFVNDSSPVPPMASFEGKIQHVNQVYKTDIEECETVLVPHIEDACLSLTPDPKPAFKDEVLAPEVLESALVEDAPVIPVAAKLISLIKEASKGISPGNSIGAIPSFDDSDELSEISEFELEDDTVNEPVATSKSTSCNHESKLTRHKNDRIRKNASSIGICATEISKPSESASKTGGHTKGVAQRLPQTGRPLLNPPVSDSSSSTRIDVSPKPPLNGNTMVGNEVVGGLSVASQDFVGLDGLEEPENGCGTFGTKLITASAGNPRTRFSPTGGELGQHPQRLIPTSDANQKERSVHAITKDTSIPPKIAGNRRKRETVKSSGKVIIEVDDGSTPPRKKRKSRDQRPGIRVDKAKSDEPSPGPMSVSRAQRSTTSAKGSSPNSDPTMVDFDKLPELKSTRNGIRRSSRIKRMQTTTAVGTRTYVMRAKTQKSDQVDDPSVKISHETPSILWSHPEPTENGESPSPKFRNDILTSAEKIHPGTNLPRDVLKAGSILLCEPSQPSVSPAKKPRGSLDLVQRASSDAMQPIQERSLIKTEETIDNQSFNSVLHTVGHNVDQAQKTEPSQSIKSIHRAEIVTIDLTIDSSPVQRKSEQHEASFVLVRPEADIQTRFGTPDQSDSVAIEAPVVNRSPRHRRRSVTFASPIEYVLDKKAKSQSQVGSFSPRHRQSPSPSENNILSPLGIPTGFVNRRHELPDPIVPQVPLQKLKISQALPIQASARDRIADEVEIQDIVEVLNEIQAVIIKGISNRFKNVRKDVQRGRDELLRQVLDELHDMVVENARYFNGLVHLEEDYYKNGNSITRCWEELIDCNDAIAAQFRKALMEHDQKISAETFPKSLLPMKPVSLSRHANV